MKNEDFESEVGKKYHSWTVIKFIGFQKQKGYAHRQDKVYTQKHAIYLVKCDCGTLSEKRISNLKTHLTTQCLSCQKIKYNKSVRMTTLQGNKGAYTTKDVIVMLGLSSKYTNARHALAGRIKSLTPTKDFKKSETGNIIIFQSGFKKLKTFFDR